MGRELEESLIWMKNKLEKDLKFLKEMRQRIGYKRCYKRM